MNGLTNATSQDVAWCPKHQTAKWCCWFDGHCLTRPGSQKTWVFISLHRLQICHSKILLIMRGDAFIHFVCGSRRVNIRLGVLLLIPKSPHMNWLQKGIWYSQTKMDNRLSLNIQDIRRSHKVYREYHGKLESRTDNRWKKLGSSENPESDLPGRCVINITICNSNDATQSHT